MLVSEVDAEMARVMARMQEKKNWSRLEEVKEEEAAAQAAAAAEEEQREAERQAAIQKREQNIKAQAKKVAKESPKKQAAAKEGWAAKDHELAGKLEVLVEKMEAEAASPNKEGGADELIEESAGLLKNLFGNLLGSSPTGGGEAVHGESPSRSRKELQGEELATLQRQQQDAERRMQEARSSGDASSLAAAAAELKELKPRIRQLQVAERRADRLADAKLNSRGPAVGSNLASIVSARRLERQRICMQARGGGMVF